MGQGASSSGWPSHGDLRAQGHQGVAHTRPWGVRASGLAGDIGLDLGRARGSWARHLGHRDFVGDIRRASLKAGPQGGSWAEIHHAAEVGRSMGSVYVSGHLARDWLTQVLDSLALYPSGLDVGHVLGHGGTLAGLLLGQPSCFSPPFSSLLLSPPIFPPHISPPPSVNRPD